MQLLPPINCLSTRNSGNAGHNGFLIGVAVFYVTILFHALNSRNNFSEEKLYNDCLKKGYLKFAQKEASNFVDR